MCFEYFLYCHVCQIANLKAALARKEAGETEHVQQSVNSSSSHETPKLKSYASSPPMQRSTTPGARKMPKDDSSSVQVINMLFTLTPSK